jgi:cobalt/nickel transport system permease protein
MIQALLFGVGGVTSLPVNALAMGLVGGFAAAAGFRALKRLSGKAALFVAGWLSVVVPAVILAVVLGIQPAIAHDADGTPLFFPFDIAITLPAITLPHALVGLGEGVLTVLVYQFVSRMRRRST